MKKIIIGTRGSKLALWQSGHVAELLKERYPELEIETKKIVTTGDKILDVPLAQIGGKALFTKEIETALLTGEIDLAVHSLKDVPTKLPDGLKLAAVLKRHHAGDALVSPKYYTLDNLPHGAKVGTSSLRRKAQLLNYRPDLIVKDLRGNVDTRLGKLTSENLDAILLAVSGLNRLGWQEVITEILPIDVCLPAVGQGALGLEARANDEKTLNLVEFLNDSATCFEVTAERSFLSQVEGSCQIPVGVYAVMTTGGQPVLNLKAAILSPDGMQAVKDETVGRPLDASLLGQNLAQKMLAAGGKEILKNI